MSMRNTLALFIRAIGITVTIAIALPQVSLAEDFDLVINGGRVMDPESGLDGVRSIGVRDGRVAAISNTPLAGPISIDATGLVVAPGFVDIHVHGQHSLGYDYMARDGVTTALDLEAGVEGTDRFLADRAGQARVNFGASAGHIPSRVKVKHGFSAGHALTNSMDTGLKSWFLKIVQRWFRPTGWMHERADEKEIGEMLDVIAAELDAGAIGIGMGLAYTPGASADEVRAIFALAAARGVPCFVHLPQKKDMADLSPLQDALEHARATGASLHVVHINSSSAASIDEYLGLIEAARKNGLDVTTEAYPYTAASTMIETALFDEGFRERRGIDYGDLQWVATGERLTAETFKKARAEGGPVIMHIMKPEWVDRAIAHPLVMIASDGMPMIEGAHPRGAGSHARVLRVYVREREVIGLMEAIAKLSLMPAQRLEAFVPAMRGKGRIRVGADADITVFNPETVRDNATFEASLAYSEGIEHVMVAGVPVVQGGELVDGAYPGVGLRAQQALGSSTSP